MVFRFALSGVPGLTLWFFTLHTCSISSFSIVIVLESIGLCASCSCLAPLSPLDCLDGIEIASLLLVRLSYSVRMPAPSEHYRVNGYFAFWGFKNSDLSFFRRCGKLYLRRWSFSQLPGNPRFSFFGWSGISFSVLQLQPYTRFPNFQFKLLIGELLHKCF